MDLSKHGGSAYEYPYGERNSAGLDASRGKANPKTALHTNKVHPEGKYKVNLDDEATNVSDTVQTIE